MAASTIIVQYKDGSPGAHMRVRLGFSVGMTLVAYTDNSGHAVVEHRSVGEAKVYVGGNNMGSFRAPGKFVATLR